MKAAFRIGNRHGAGRIAVIAALESHDPVATRNATVAPILHRHFQRHLDRDRPGLAEKYAVEIASTEQTGEPARQGQSLLVHQPAKHHMRHARQLPFHGTADVRMIVAVTRRPPRRDAIDQFPSVGEHDATPPGRFDRKGKRRRFHLRIGQPQMLQPGFELGGIYRG